MQAISALKRKGVASMFQFVPWHKLSIVYKKSMLNRMLCMFSR